MLLRIAPSVVLAVVVAVVLGGCGGHVADVSLEDDREAPGPLSLDKPLPDFAQLFPQMQARALGQLLPWNGAPRSATVPNGECSWWRTHRPTAARRVIFTLQQAPDQDSDLYVLKRQPWMPGAVLGMSQRGAGSGLPDYTSYGVPDWVSVVLDPTTTGTPQVLVYGMASPQAAFSIEVDTVDVLGVNYNNVSHVAWHTDSRWFRFRALPGQQHSVKLTAESPDSDPDLFVYDTTSSGPVGDDTGYGGGTVVFTPNNSRWHYVRVYGAGSVDNNVFNIMVTSP